MQKMLFDYGLQIFGNVDIWNQKELLPLKSYFGGSHTFNSVTKNTKTYLFLKNFSSRPHKNFMNIQQIYEITSPKFKILKLIVFPCAFYTIIIQ